MALMVFKFNYCH